MALFDQAEFDVRFEWSLPGLQALAPISDTVVIVDVLSFTTCVSIAVDRGAHVFPYRFRDRGAAALARDMDAYLAVDRGRTSRDRPYSLSPQSMTELPDGARVVLPSPNGSALSFSARDTEGTVLAGSLRNATAVAIAAKQNGRTTAVIAAGERWEGRDALRPAVEDLWGAGAIIREIPGRRSPESEAAAAAFEAVRNRIGECLDQTISGKELRSMGYGADVALASEHDVSSSVPLLTEGAFVRRSHGRAT